MHGIGHAPLLVGCSPLSAAHPVTSTWRFQDDLAGGLKPHVRAPPQVGVSAQVRAKANVPGAPICGGENRGKTVMELDAREPDDEKDEEHERKTPIEIGRVGFFPHRNLGAGLLMLLMDV